MTESRSPFDAYYFAHCCGRPYGRDPEWLTFFGRIADRIVSDIGPRTVLDVGCAWGLLVEALRARGVEAYGTDVSSYAISKVAPEVAAYCRVSSIAEPMDRRYDLIVCMEVVEHVAAAECDRGLQNLAHATDDLLFSSSPFDYREPTHVNVRPPAEWAEALARLGLFRDVDFDASFITPWAWRAKRDTPTLHGLVHRYERWATVRDHAATEARAYALEMQQQLALDDTRRERLADAEQTIRAMESSMFWKMRRPWAWVSRRLLGR